MLISSSFAAAERSGKSPCPSVGAPPVSMPFMPMERSRSCFLSRSAFLCCVRSVFFIPTSGFIALSARLALRSARSPRSSLREDGRIPAATRRSHCRRPPPAHRAARSIPRRSLPVGTGGGGRMPWEMSAPAETHWTIRPALSSAAPSYRSWNLLTTLSMPGVPGEEVQGVAQGRGERRDPLRHRLGASGQGHHQDGTHVSREASGEDRHRGVSETARAEELPVTRDLAIEESPDGLRSDVSRAEPRATRGGQGIDGAVRDPAANLRFYARLLVGDHRAVEDRKAELR